MEGVYAKKVPGFDDQEKQQKETMTETRFVSCGGAVNERYFVWSYVQYCNGKPVARFKIKEDWKK